MKRGRPQLKEGEVDFRKRNVTVAQMNFLKLAECYQLVTGDVSKSIWDVTGKLSSEAVTEILGLFIVMAKGDGGEKRESFAAAINVRSELLKDPLFHHAVVLCGANSYKELRMAHPSLTEALPDYKAIWRSKVDLVADELLPHLELHDVGFEIDPLWMMSRAVSIFNLWDTSYVTLRWSFDGAAVGVTVMGFSLIHSSIPSDTNHAFFPVALWRGPESAYFLRKQAPKSIELIENYATQEWRDDRSGGFVKLNVEHKVRYQMFLNPDMKAMLGATELSGCVVCPYSFQGVRAADPCVLSSVDAYLETCGENVPHPELPNGWSIYSYTTGSAESATSVFVMHSTLKEGERMKNPTWLPTRTPDQLLPKNGDYLRVRILMLVPDFMLHGRKRLVEKLVRDALAELMNSQLLDKAKIEKVGDFMRSVRGVVSQNAAQLDVFAWLDESNRQAGRVLLSSHDAALLLPDLSSLIAVLGVDDTWSNNFCQTQPLHSMLCLKNYKVDQAIVERLLRLIWRG